MKAFWALALPFLQKYYFIPLDIFFKTMENKGIGDGLGPGWRFCVLTLRPD